MKHTDIPRMDLNLLSMFHAIYVEKQLSRAGQRLGLTQPAMSHGLTRLRGVFGDDLFLRTPRGVEPTARAHQLAEPIMAALDNVRRALSPPEAFEPSTAAAVFRLGMLDFEVSLLAPRLAARLAKEAPNIDIRIRHTRRRQSLDLLDGGELDLAVGVFDELPSRFLRKTLFVERFVTVTRRDHPAAGSKNRRMTLETYLSLPHLLISFAGDDRGVVDGLLAKLGKTRRVAMTIPHFLPAPLAIANSDMIATFASRVAEDAKQTCGLALFEPPLEIPPFTVSAVWHKRVDSDPAFRWLLSTVETLTESI